MSHVVCAKMDGNVAITTDQYAYIYTEFAHAN